MVPNNILSFGPEGSEWKYDRVTKSYDLSYGSIKKLHVASTRQPKSAISISPESSVLVIVDMQNFFINPKCRDHRFGVMIVEPITKMIDICRKEGIDVVWFNWGLTEEDLKTIPAGLQHGYLGGIISGSGSTAVGGIGLGAEMGEGKGRALFEESWNAEVYGPLKKVMAPVDSRCNKNRVSGLWSSEQPLYKYLMGSNPREIQKKTVLFAGVNTDACILGTLLDAFNTGWDCILVEDCCAALTKERHETCINNIARHYSFVTDSNNFTE